ncbi:mRNA cleavage and polyadenylation specificity factor complex subunit pta1 [Pseudocercospora fuligena]|uniref:mRNA cleavage and polyadenylation specificity factor complex subunit pta1 n=1 Tax=Pseudocercospora fuligena TaxID=685502 RepID=A0A8H6VIX7_9PEZI|nr:mRNA cleavage and polyadenylation specificity factor complex subunit pta1 [Pseudocercospora fuligena]
MASPKETLTQLNSARDIVLRDHTLYTQVVPGIVQVIAPGADLELRRWGADFLAETFASQVVTAEAKQHMSLVVLDTLKGYLNRKEIAGEDEDTAVVKSAVQCAASIYPFVFRHTVSNTTDKETWSKIAAIKSSILRRMDTAVPGVRICCIKFVASVVQTQTPGLIADPRRQEQNEISLALVPRDHPVIPPANLEAEASGLLDRLLGVLQDNLTDPLIITATLNALATLVQRRASVSSKILMTILNFNPLKLANRPMSGKDKIAIKSMTRTTMSFLLNCLKRNPNHALAGRMQQGIERLKHSLTEVFSENHQLKRPAPDEPIDGLDDAKRQRLDAEAVNGTTPLQQSVGPSYPPLPPGPVSIAQIWTLTNHQQSATFDVTRLPLPTVVQLVPALLQAVPQQKINEAINAVRTRWLGIGDRVQAAEVNSGNAEEDDEDYDPSMGFNGDTDQVMNRLDQRPRDAIANDVAIGPFSLPPPPPLSEHEKDDYSRTAVMRVFGNLSDLDREAKTKGKPAQIEHGFNRLAATSASGHDREGWITLLTRLATRAPFDLDEKNGEVKKEGADLSVAKKGQTRNLSNDIREGLLRYVMDNFRSRIDVAIAWLNEEWYSDRLLNKQREEDGETTIKDDLPNYWTWVLRLLDTMMPYIDVKDQRILIRLLSEVPAINDDLLSRLKKIAEDPERINIVTNTLLYLVMFRPPVRELAINTAEQMFRENKDAKTAAKKILVKWRPAVLEQEAGTEVKAEA